MSFDFATMSVTPATPGEVAPVPTNVDENRLTYVTVTQDRLNNIRRNLPVILPHVDRVVILDGGSKDGTLEYLESLGPKVEVYHRDWDDSFANQYNEYLKHIHYGWALLCDDDELPSEELLQSLREIISQSEGARKYDVVEFRANDISYVEGEWENRHDTGPCEYYRPLLFKWNPNLHYVINLHQSLQGLVGPAIRCKAHYYHIKSIKDEYRNACRNYFIAGEWPPGAQEDGIRTPEWEEMKDILSRNHPEVSLFSHLNSLLVTGSVCQEFKSWMTKYQEYGKDDGHSGELRAYYGYYFNILSHEA